MLIESINYNGRYICMLFVHTVLVSISDSRLSIRRHASLLTWHQINITIGHDELAFRNSGEIKKDFKGGRNRNESAPSDYRASPGSILEC